MEIKIGDKITSKHTGVIREVTNIKDDLIFIGNTGMHITKDELKHFITPYDEVEIAKTIQTERIRILAT
ncbi:hypothetical protein ETI08_03570 [Macrococcoides goetzii]|nr:hypothetical protein [Macrococcus goetzii]TDM48230.1 hypothetical protein ETI08_03570 [Macrococcus goetzii]